MLVWIVSLVALRVDWTFGSSQNPLDSSVVVQVIGQAVESCFQVRTMVVFFCRSLAESENSSLKQDVCPEKSQNIAQDHSKIIQQRSRFQFAFPKTQSPDCNAASCLPPSSAQTVEPRAEVPLAYTLQTRGICLSLRLTTTMSCLWAKVLFCPNFIPWL